MEMFYNTYANLGLPDKMIFSFNVKDYKMPKGVTLDFDDDMKPEEKAKLKHKKGKSLMFCFSLTLTLIIKSSGFWPEKSGKSSK